MNKTNYNLLQDSLNIDDLVDPRMTTVSRIMEHVHRGTIGTVYSLLDGEYEFIEAKISEKSELINKKIRIQIYQRILGLEQLSGMIKL